MTWFRLLGPVGVDFDGKPLPLRGPKQRALLAMLLLQPGEVVSRDRLIEGLWGQDPPGNVEHALDAQVSALRRVLVPTGPSRLSRRSPGYVLQVGVDELDVTQFEREVTEGRRWLAQGQNRDAAEHLRGALSLWRGPALVDVLDAPFAGPAAAELDERRLQAVEDRLEADVALGLGSELVDELVVLVQRNPLRERLLADLALVLYRSGQQARSLETLATARRSFLDELGIEPSAGVRHLEQRILQQDRTLLPSPRPSVEDLSGSGRPPRDDPPRGPPPEAERPRKDPARRPALLQRVETRISRSRTSFPALLAVVVLALTAAVLGGDSTARQSTAPSDRPAVMALDGSSGKVTRRVDMAATPVSLVSDGDGLWAALTDENVLAHVDGSTGSRPSGLRIPSGPGSVAWGDGAVWVTGVLGGTVSRIDPQTEQPTQTVTVGGKPSAVAYDGRHVWLTEPIGRRLIRLDPASGRVERTVTLSDRPSNLAVDGKTVWVADAAGTVTAVDPESAAVLSTVRVGSGPTALTLGAGSVWVANSIDATVTRLDALTGQVEATIPVGDGPTDIAYSNGAIWVSSQFARTVSRVDPGRNQVTRVVRLPAPPMALAPGNGRVWIGTRADNSSHRGGTVTLLGARSPRSFDPALESELFPAQFLGLAYDGLTAFQQESGPDGMQLAPDLAEALPTPTAAGTVYTFRLRPGMLYSTGEPVRASDFRRAIERLFRLGSQGKVDFDGLLGADTCRFARPSCSLAAGILTDDTLGTVEFHLSAPDADFPVGLALPDAAPIPLGTSTATSGGNIPGTGPYEIASTSSRTVRFERNPFFREWSPLAHPDGIPDTIVWRFGDSAADAVRSVEAGTADWTGSGVPVDMLAEVANHHAGQLHVSDLSQTDFLQLNTQKPPFDDVRVRQAFNLALDRAQVVAAYGGADLARQTCQVLPPGSAGWVPYCPYTQSPSPAGRWVARDLVRARQLVAASGTSGTTVDLLAGYPLPAAVTPVLARTLSQLGYRVKLRSTDPTDPEGFAVEVDSLAKAMSWTSPLPAPFFQNFVACLGSKVYGWFCDPALDRLFGQAHDLEATDPGRSDELWASADRRTVDAAALVPLVNPSSVELLSARIHGFRINPLFGFSPAQAWVG